MSHHLRPTRTSAMFLLLLDGLLGPSTLPLQVAALIVLLVLSAFFSGSEVALIGFSKLRRRQLVEEEHPRIGAVERLMAKPARVLITILIGNTLVNVLAASLATTVAISLAVQAGVSEATAVGVATGLMTFLILTFSEITPKAYAARNNERMSLRIAPLLLAIQRLLTPVVWAYEKFTNLIFRLFGGEGEGMQELRTEEELKTLITMGTEEGIIEEEEEEMIHSVIEFADTTAKEIMVPRIDMSAVPADATLGHVRAFALDSGFSRIPVYQGTLDNVVGVLYVKDMLLRMLEGKGSMQVRELMREPYLVPETKKLDELLSEMRERRVHLAIVIDEFGGTAGLLTLEDVLEEIVGEIFDEYDLRTEPIRRLDDTTAVVDARTHVADVNDALAIQIPEDGPFDTVAGFIFNTLGRLGKEGEVIHYDGFDMVVEKVLNRRILRARIVKKREGEEEAEEARDDQAARAAREPEREAA